MEPDSSSGDVDVDEDGNVVTPEDSSQEGRKPSTPPATPIQPAALAPRTGPIGTLLAPKKEVQSASPVALVTSHLDFPEQIGLGIHKIREMIANDCWDFEWNPVSFYRVLEVCNTLFSLISGQIDQRLDLKTSMPTFHEDYLNIADVTEDWGAEINAKLELMSRAIKLAGMGVRDAPKRMPILPSEAMRIRIRQELEPWQATPDETGVMQIAELIVQAMKKQRLLMMIIDVDPHSGIAHGAGKSQLLYAIMYWVYWLLEQELKVVYPFDARKDTVYRADRERFERMMRTVHDRPIGVDEINQFFDLWHWQNPENQWLVHQIEMDRKLGRWVIGACSQVWILNKRFRQVIVTHRLSITEWDDDTFQGKFTLYEKYGTPAEQVEEENKWGREKVQGAFAGLTRPQFRFYSDISNKTADIEDRMGLDKYLSENPDWLADAVEPGVITERPEREPWQISHQT